VKEKLNHALPYVFLALVALSRWPGLFPPSFSAVYALVFCAGAYFRGRMAWWLPLGTLLLSDVALNFYWQSKGWEVWTGPKLLFQSFVYVSYVLMILLGRRFRGKSSFAAMLGGGMLGSLIFYLITNTASWLCNPFDNPEYKLTITGWLLAVIKGTGGWPDAWMFFRNTLLSGGLFTALFVAAMKLTAPAESPADKRAGAREDESEAEPVPEPEEANA
jgi:hypothetical protein